MKTTRAPIVVYQFNGDQTFKMFEQTTPTMATIG